VLPPVLFAQGAQQYPRTAAEIAAGVTPSKLNFPPDAVGMLERYGAVGNGAADDNGAIQSAIAVASQGSQTVYLTQGKSYRFTQPIRLSHEGKFRNLVAPMLAVKSPFAISPKLIYDGPANSYAIDSDGNGTSHCLLQGFNLTFAKKRTRNGINFDSVAHSTIRGVHVYEADTAIRAARTWNTRIVDSHFTDSNDGIVVDREVNATTIVNSRFNRNAAAGVKLHATISGLLFSGGSVDNNDIGIAHTARHIDWIKFDGTYIENNRVGISHSGSATASNWIWSAYFQHLGRSEVWYEVKAAGTLVVSFRDTTIDGQPKAGKKKLVDYSSGEFRPLIDNLALVRGATFSGSGDTWKRHLRYRSHYKGSAYKDVAIEPQLQSSWVNSDDKRPVRYWRNAEGQVHISGRIQGGIVGSANVFTLVEGYRPANLMEVPVATLDTRGERQIGFLQIQPGGAVRILDGENTAVFVDVTFHPD
jgi:hypothetical protein